MSYLQGIVPISHSTLVAYVCAAILPILLGIWWPFIAIPWFIYCIYTIYYQFYDIQYLQCKDRTVYITGCDSGIGYETAIHLVNKGPGFKCGERVTVLDLDVTSDEKVKNCGEIVGKECAQNGLWALFNNAGIAMAGEIEWTSMHDYRKSFEVNVFGTLNVTKSVLQHVRKAEGRVVTTTSGIARWVYPGRSPYCMTKSALEAMSDCLRYEMNKFGVKCITLTPGNFVGSTQVFTGLASNLDKTLCALEPSVRNAYGEEYLQAFRNNVCGNYVAESGSNSLSPILEDVYNAMFQVNPRVRYTPAQFDWLMWWMANSLLPAQFCDWFVIRRMRNMPKIQ